MREFFLDEVPGISFNLFGITHIMCLLVLFGGLLLIYLFQDKIAKISEKDAKKIKLGMIGVWLFNRFLYVGSYIYYGIYTWKEDLPIHFCFITGYLFVLYVLTNKKSLFKLTYFMAFVGPLTATIWPDLTSSFDYYIFYEFFTSHHLFVLFVFFVYYMDKVKITKKDMWKSFTFANGVFLFAIIFNQLFGTNYIMSKELPQHVLNLYPFLEYINKPIVILEIVGFIVMLLAFIPVYFKNKKNIYNS